MPKHPWQVILLPGSVMPAGPAYGALLAELGTDVDARAKELEVYARWHHNRRIKLLEYIEATANLVIGKDMILYGRKRGPAPAAVSPNGAAVGAVRSGEG